MRILYVSQYYPPEIGAPAVRVSHLSRYWREAGCDARVLTGFPNHPEGVVHPEYRKLLRRGFCEEEIDGVPVYRTWLYPAANRGVVRRSLNYASFMASAALRGRLLDFRPDVVIGTSPQLLAAAAGASLARHFGVPFVFEARDLWPESLEAVGAFQKGSAPYRAVDWIADRLYRRAWKIVVTTEASRRILIEKGFRDADVAVIRNAVDTSRFHGDFEAATSAEFPAAAFTVAYFGTLGMAHGLRSVIDAAALLRDQQDIQFVFVGGGAEREALTRYAKDHGVGNVRFTGPRPWEEMPALMAAADIALVHLNNSPLFETVLPSKMFEAMAAGKPVILGVRGEARQLLEEAGAGIAVTPESPDEIRDAVLKLRADAALRKRLGEAGKQYASSEASYPSRAEAYLKLLRSR